MKVGIVGAGIIGTAVSHSLIDEGHEVTLVDSRGFAGGASRGNAGWIAHLDVLPLASPNAWRHIPRWLLDPLGPLAIRPGYLGRIALWLVRFAAASRPERVLASSQAIAALNRLALPAWERLLGQLRLEHHLRPRGFISVWPDRRAFAAAERMVAHQRMAGIPVETLAAEELRRLEPALGPAAVAGAFYESGCHVSDPRDLTMSLGEAAIARGATLLRSSVASVASESSGIRLICEDGSRLLFDRVVIAAGAWSRPLAAALGERIPLDCERGYNITLAPGSLGLTRPVVFEGYGFVTTPLDSGDRVVAGLDAPPNFARVDAMLERLRPFLPDSNLEGGERWMGFRPSIPDSLPVIGRSRKHPRVAYAFGHGHYGLTQAAATAQLVAAVLVNREAGLDLAPFSPQRF